MGKTKIIGTLTVKSLSKISKLQDAIVSYWWFGSAPPSSRPTPKQMAQIYIKAPPVV